MSLQPDAPIATTAHAAATGSARVGMSVVPRDLVLLVAGGDLRSSVALQRTGAVVARVVFLNYRLSISRLVGFCRHP